MNTKMPKDLLKFMINYNKFCISQKYMLDNTNDEIKIVPYNKRSMIKFLKSIKPVRKETDETDEKS
jgi:hypothetical protein